MSSDGEMQVRRAVKRLGDCHATDLVVEAKECLAKGDERSLTRDGPPRTLGGCYCVLVNERIRQKDAEKMCSQRLNEPPVKYKAQPYQEEIIARVLELFGRRENALVVQPTGTGKTFEAGEVIRQYSHGPVVFLQNTKVSLAFMRLLLIVVRRIWQSKQ